MSGSRIRVVKELINSRLDLDSMSLTSRMDLAWNSLNIRNTNAGFQTASDYQASIDRRSFFYGKMFVFRRFFDAQLHAQKRQKWDTVRTKKPCDYEPPDL